MVKWKKKDLEIKLEHVIPFQESSARLEQYSTPASIASEILFSAYSKGDIFGCVVNDLGCGTGILSIGAKILGARVVRGYDVSPSAIKVAKENAEAFDLDIEFYERDISQVGDRADVTLMNPPFGCQLRNADRPFLDKAIDLSRSVYSIHMASTKNFLNKYVGSKGKKIISQETYKYNMPHAFTFHTRSRREIDIVVVMIR
ncbi:MAG: METTL5 family protein [archaeon]|nr:METTL5 family protein [archaeon]